MGRKSKVAEVYLALIIVVNLNSSELKLNRGEERKKG